MTNPTEAHYGHLSFWAQSTAAGVSFALVEGDTADAPGCQTAFVIAPMVASALGRALIAHADLAAAIQANAAQMELPLREGNHP